MENKFDSDEFYKRIINNYPLNRKTKVVSTNIPVSYLIKLELLAFLGIISCKSEGIRIAIRDFISKEFETINILKKIDDMLKPENIKDTKLRFLIKKYIEMKLGV